MATEDNWKELIKTNYPDLLEIIDTENGLRGEIKKLDVFRPIALKSFWGYTDTTKRIDRMLQNLQKTDFGTFKLFCDALINSNQGHVVRNHLSQVKDTSSQPMTTDSAAGVDSSQNRGISRHRKECLRQNWNDLIFEIVFDEVLMAELEKYSIVTQTQLNTLRDKTTETDRIEYMLNLLEHGSEMRFESFCRALESSKQGRIVVEYLTLNQDQRSSSIPDPLPSTNSSPGESTRSLPVAPAPLQREPQEVLLSGVSLCTDEFRKQIDEKVKSKVAYRCDRKPRGRAIIISNEKFRVKHLSRRYGTQNDISCLRKLFPLLHFDTKVYEDKTAEEILEILKNESKDAGNFHLKCDMFVLFIMSHGIRGEVFGVDGKPVKTTAIMELFNGENCPNLCSKPKLIFIQACQIDLVTTGVPASDGNMTATDSGIEGACSSGDSDMLEKLKAIEDVELSLPLDPLPLYQHDAHSPVMVHKLADMSLIYATVEGDVAWRNMKTGGLFVQAIVDVFAKQAHEQDVMSMITYVIGKLHDEDVVDGKSRYKQIAEKRDTLRRKVYLLP